MEWTSIRTTLIAAAIAATLPGVAHAVRVDYTIDAGYEHDDNVTLSEVDPIETDIARLGVGFSVEQASSVVRASVVGRIDHRRYQDVFDGMTDRMLEGRLHWEVLPDRLAFVVEDSYGVQTINRFSPDAPDNRQQVNVLSLGPTFMFRPGNLRGLAELRYINSDAEVTEDFNSDRVLGALRLAREIDATSSLSWNVQAQQIDFDNDLVARDHNRIEMFASYARNYRRFDLLVDAGYAHLDYDDGESRGRPLVRAEIGWNPSTRSRFSVNLANQFSDAATSTLDAIDTSSGVPTSVITGNTTVTASAFEQRSVMAQYEFQGTRTAVSLHGQVLELDYVDVGDSNEEIRSVGASLRYRLRPTLTIGASANIDRNQYETPANRRETNRLYAASLEKEWSRHWSSSLSYTRYERSSSLLTGQFEQNVVYLSLSYRNR
jgi:hypothetical protein